jgi:hypothetical protein
MKKLNSIDSFIFLDYLLDLYGHFDLDDLETR